MHICFELSGENRTLPAAEVYASLFAEEIRYRVVKQDQRVIIVKIDKNNATKLQLLGERLSMTHRIYQVVTTSAPEKQAVLDVINRIDISRFIKQGQTYCVRVRRLEPCPLIKTPQVLEPEIGEIIYRYGNSANLQTPDVCFKLLLISKMAIFGILLHSINRSSFEERKPKNKPFFYPGVLMPRISRTLINLCEIKKNELLLDPFCGTAGILVEAGLLNVDVIGSDIQWKIVSGAKMNLEYYLKKYTLMYQDAAHLALKDESVDAVVTDPPYGRSTRIKSVETKKLIEDSIKEIWRVLKKGRKAGIVYKEKIDEVITGAGFSIVEYHQERVHKSLTRHLYIIKKE
ncbi:MAG: tRNA (guanine10-N2)-dimethyltransferase [Candidatus Argoarchaeum ethanivorans]|uniref:tRNA (guanine(10)-N(2))-dimethyltransferase n=1 Tax=Candidatus Argoarchaeum ethanivorans TaxID=2608793 RepID=A0A8B3S272_9EURY|nr:MAG: tRNA (guanine10-N2)-dimethyltransferase [Candidatus Argoarchaeum ethanivorans]